MTDQKKLKVIEEAFNYYHDRNSLTSKDEKELLNLVNELYAAISVTRCCETLKVKDLMTFEDYKNKLFIEECGVYQPKKTKLFRWYSEKQLKKLYKDKPL